MPRTHDLWQVIKVTSGTLRNTKRTEQSVLVTSQVCVCVSVCVELLKRSKPVPYLALLQRFYVFHDARLGIWYSGILAFLFHDFLTAGLVPIWHTTQL